ncbi:MAG: hypothetical protein Fur0037_24910 [Planctomycetota bacterium]
MLLLAAPISAQTPDPVFYRDSVFGKPVWQELGPVAFGGRIVDIEVHPSNRHVYWVAGASGGIWKTENGGISFQPQFQDRYTCSIGDLAVAPSAPDRLYVGTGEANNQRSSYWGDGVWRSDDGGKTWTHKGLDGTDHIGRIAVHPTNADIVLVAAPGALYHPNEQRGLYRTEDGGDTWKKVADCGADVGFIDVVIDPTDPSIAFAASYERRRRAWNFQEGGVGSRIWKSTDGGETWTKLAGGLPEGELGRIGIDVSPVDGRVYAVIENLNPAPVEKPADTSSEPREADRGSGRAAKEPSAEELADPLFSASELDAEEEPAGGQEPERRTGGQDRRGRGAVSGRRRQIGGEVYRSDDHGVTWRKVSGRTRVGGEPPYYYGQIHVDPRDPDTVYVLGVMVSVTRNGGKTWSSGRRENFANGLHVDHHALWIDPTDSGHILLGNDGGLAETFDGGAHWDHIARLPIAQYYAIAVDDRVPYRIYGGLQDNGTWGFPVQGGSSAGIRPSDAFRIGGGDGFCVAIDREDPDIVYSESQFGGMSRQNLRTSEHRSIRPKAEKGSPPLRFNWMTPLVLSPHSSQTVYTGSQYLHRSRNRGDDWQTISPDLTTNDPDKLAGDVPHCTITTISESPLQEGLIWVGTDDGRLFLTPDGGSHWIERTDRLPREARGLWVSRVEASPHARDSAVVSLTGYREDRREPWILRTDDRGLTLRTIVHGLPSEPVNVVRHHPRNPHCLLAGTEMGCYASVDDGASWYPLGAGLPRVAVHDLVVHPREHHVIVGTHGRGIWVLDAALLETLDDAVLHEDFAVFAPSNGAVLPRSFSRGYEGARTWSVPSPFLVPEFHFYLRMDGDEKVLVEVLDARGREIWKREVDPEAGYHAVRWEVQRGGRGFAGRFPGGGLSISRRGRDPAGPRPGTFAVRISQGERSEVMAFSVEDRRKRGGISPIRSAIGR